MNFQNCYDDATRAEAYATLEFERTYYLAYRDLPRIIAEHVRGNRAVDFGCGTGRSTRFLQKLGFQVVGIDVSRPMLEIARRMDPTGDYRLVSPGDLSSFARGSYDLALSAFTFDNVAPIEEKVRLFRELRDLLNRDGRIVNIVSSPEMYWHEWASFSTKDFPDNKSAVSGALVRIIVTDHGDRRPVQDILCSDETYRSVYRSAGVRVLGVYRPLATGDEPYEWVSETRIPPWVIYALGKEAASTSEAGTGEERRP